VLHSCNGGVYSAEYCCLGSVIYEDGKASSQVANLYSMQYIKFTSDNFCNGRWTRIGTGNSSAADAYETLAFASLLRLGSMAERDVERSQSDQYKLIKWVRLPGTVRSAANCFNEGHSIFAPFTFQVSLVDITISLKPIEVKTKIVVGTYVRINDEILKVTNVSSGTVTVTREQAKTAQKIHYLGVAVFALSQVALEPIGVPAPATSFASHLIFFTTGTCQGR